MHQFLTLFKNTWNFLYIGILLSAAVISTIFWLIWAFTISSFNWCLTQFNNVLNNSSSFMKVNNWIMNLHPLWFMSLLALIVYSTIAVATGISYITSSDQIQKEVVCDPLQEQCK